MFISQKFAIMFISGKIPGKQGNPNIASTLRLNVLMDSK